MPNNHWAKTALPSAAGISIDLLRTGLMQSTVTVLPSGDNPQNLIGDIAGAILWQGKLFYYDATDTTTAHDGISCAVTFDGRRYKPDTVGLVRYSAKDKDLTAPPAAPTIGDAYIMPLAPMGLWAGQASKIALFTVRGWQFITPFVGLACYVEDEDGYYRYKSSGWAQGIGNYALNSGNVIQSNLMFPFGVIVESTLNTPPAVTNGLAYIIGASPTGAWVGHSGKVAIGEAGIWVLYIAPVGAIVFDKSLGFEVCYKSGAWQVDRAAGKIVGFVQVGSHATPTATFPAVSSTITYTAKKATNLLRFTLTNANWVLDGGFGLRRDLESTWRWYRVGAITQIYQETSSGPLLIHTYKIFADRVLIIYHLPLDVASHDYKFLNLTSDVITLEEIEI